MTKSMVWNNGSLMVDEAAKGAGRMNLYRVHEPFNAWPTVEWNGDIPDRLCGDVLWYHEGETVSLASKHFALGGKPLMMTHDGYYARISLRHMTAFTVEDGESVEDAYQRMLKMLQPRHGREVAA